MIEAKEIYTQFDNHVAELVCLESKLDKIVSLIMYEIPTDKTLPEVCSILGCDHVQFSDLMEYNYSKFTMEQLNSISDKINDYIQESGN